MRRRHRTMVLAAALAAALPLACGKGSEDGQPGSQGATGLAEKTLEELESGESAKIAFSGAIGPSQEISIDFRLRDWGKVPKDVKSLAETEAHMVPLAGRMGFRAIQKGATREIDKFHTAPPGKVILYLVYEIQCGPHIPHGNTIHPHSVLERGWDPAPQPVTVVDGDDRYPGVADSNALCSKLGMDRRAGFEATGWTRKAAAWKIPEGQNPTLALKYIDLAGAPRYVRIDI